MIILANHRNESGAQTGRSWGATLLLVAAGLCLALSILFPIWRITLEAPQYPEGLGMYIHARTIDGLNPHDLETINELNHYIGMKKIVPSAIPELRFISPLILAFAALSLLAAFRPRAWSTGLLLAALSGAGAVGMYDFWRWEYDYGHNLNPMAAIKVPGMSYQPPLLGEAHLLNFVSQSWPAIGGCLLFEAGILIALSLALSLARDRGWRLLPRFGRAARGVSIAALGLLFATGCGSRGPVPFQWGEDACRFCKMILAEKGFAAQRINSKGKVYKYDSIECLLADLKANPPQAGERLYVSDRSRPEAPLAEAGTVHYLRGGSLASPMGQSLAAFASEDSVRAWQARLGGDRLEWDRLRIR
ncbi:MAG: nitrous oxide reductase accessory protein NosL [Fibrobacteres bacterium]|nr:nitrous oxide reductase accessory protein NosL [Fibrobacterota bacterium]